MKENTLNANKFQDFNYHTHTNRCGHASIFTEKEYVEHAKAAGIKQLGFSDHVPHTSLEYPDINTRMHPLEIDEYITTIKNLQKHNPDIKILCGFEAEYNHVKEAFLGELREKVDYLILGQHFIDNGFQRIQSVGNPNYPIEYAKIVCQAMDSGLFDIVVHPDMFLEFRDTISNDQKTLYEENAKKAILMICTKSKELNIPLEINFYGIDKNIIKQDGEYAYPHSSFWKIAAKIGAPVLYGVDAHNPNQFAKMNENKKKADKLIDSSKLNLIKNGYNPKEARKNNPKLQELYNNSQAKALTFETHFINEIAATITTASQLDDFITKETTMIKQQIQSNINSLSNDQKLSNEEKTFLIKRANHALKQIDITATKRKEIINKTMY